MAAIQPDALTVVIPTAGRRPLLRAAIASALDQRPAPARVLVVDDSDDHAARRFVDGFADDKVTWIPNARRRGPSGARNAGLDHATTPLVAFLDDDDHYEPGFVERSLDAWSRSPSDTIAIWSAIVEVFEDGREHRRTVWTPRGATPHERLTHAILTHRFGSGHGLSVDRRAFLDVGGFNETLRAGEDVDALYRILLAGSVAPIDACLVRVRRYGTDRLSGDPAAYATTYDLLTREHADRLLASPTARHALERARMRWHLLSGQWRTGSAIAWSLMRFGPAPVRAKAAAIYVLFALGVDPRRMGISR